MAEEKDQRPSRSVLEYFSWKDLVQQHSANIFVYIDTLSEFCSLFDLKSDVDDMSSDQAAALGTIKKSESSGLIALRDISHVLIEKFDFLVLLDQNDAVSQELAGLFEEEARSRRLVGAPSVSLQDAASFKRTVHNVVGFIVIMLSRAYIEKLEREASSEVQRLLYILGFGPHQLASRLLLINVETNLVIPRFTEKLAYNALNECFSLQKPLDWSQLRGSSREIWRAALVRRAFAEVAALYPSEKRLRCVVEREKSRVIWLLENNSSTSSSGWLNSVKALNEARELMENNQHDVAMEMLQVENKALKNGGVPGPSRLRQVAQFLFLQCQSRAGVLSAEEAGAALAALLVNLATRRLDVLLAADAFELAVAQCLVCEIYLPQCQAEGTSSSERTRVAQQGSVLLFALLRAHLSPATSLAQSYQQAVTLGFSDADVLAAVESVELLPGYLAKYVEMLLQLLAFQGHYSMTISVFRVASKRLGQDSLAQIIPRVSAVFVRVYELHRVDFKAHTTLWAVALQWADLAGQRADLLWRTTSDFRPWTADAEPLILEDGRDMSVLRGWLLDRNEAALPEATVQELGRRLRSADGAFAAGFANSSEALQRRVLGVVDLLGQALR
eukprot:gene29872-36067_t